MRSNIVAIYIISAALGATAAPASAADETTAQLRTRAPVFAELINCRSLQDEKERLACFDKQVALIDQAEKDNQVVVMDRRQVKTARRGIFGLTLPNISKIFGGRTSKEGSENLSELESTIESSRKSRSGKWIFTIEDGATWMQKDNLRVFGQLKPGTSVRIKRAAMGSFLANIDGQRAIRVRRIK